MWDLLLINWFFGTFFSEFWGVFPVILPMLLLILSPFGAGIAKNCLPASDKMTQEKAAKPVRFEILSVVTLKLIVFWDGTSCGVVVVYRCFRGTYCFHRQGGD
jgi:hypothetical protein